PLPQDIEEVVQRGIAIALDAIFLQLLGPSERDLPRAFLAKQHIIVFFLSERLPFLDSQVDTGAVRRNRYVAGIDPRHRESAQLVVKERICAPRLDAILHVQEFLPAEGRQGIVHHLASACLDPLRTEQRGRRRQHKKNPLHGRLLNSAATKPVFILYSDTDISSIFMPFSSWIALNGNLIPETSRQSDRIWWFGPERRSGRARCRLPAQAS